MTVQWTVRAAEDRARSSRENRVPTNNVAKQHKNTASPTALPTVKSCYSTNACYARGATASEFAIRRTTRRMTQDIASQYARVQGLKDSNPLPYMQADDLNQKSRSFDLLFLFHIVWGGSHQKSLNFLAISSLSTLMKLCVPVKPTHM